MPALSQTQVNNLQNVYGDAWKAPLGPYHQAPATHGSGWWMVNPFTGPTPWEKELPAEKQLPPGFKEIFGEEPGVGDPARGRWLTDLKYFKQAGVPPDFDPDAIAAASKVTEAWGMGKPAFYEGRYGWKTRFPGQKELAIFEADPELLVENVHFVVALFQVRQLQEGKVPSKKHPFVPLHLWPA